jgi:hypothetical protein
VRRMGNLLLTTENIQLVLAGIASFDDERTAYQFYVKEKMLAETDWQPYPRETLSRAYRSILATRNLLRIWTRPEKLQAIFLDEPLPVGICGAINEALPLEFSLRSRLEPRWPLELDLRSEYAQLDRIFARARSECRVKYLVNLYENDRLNFPVPGPLVLTRLPYSRKIFALRATLDSFSGFPGY